MEHLEKQLYSSVQEEVKKLIENENININYQNKKYYNRTPTSSRL
jgi:hypothetical protein